MRSTIVGIILGIVLVAALFAAARYIPRPSAGAEAKQAAASVAPGFVGSRNIGDWELTCESKPQSMNPGAGKPAVSLGRCHTNLMVRRRAQPPAVVLVMTFRVFGADKHLLTVIRTLPLTTKGQFVILQVGKMGLKVPVANCTPNECVAAGGLSAKAESTLAADQRGAIVFPAPVSGKRAFIPFPTNGLSDALAAMRRADSAAAA